MSKRVLRDRSTLRPPPEEPPIKRVPPKPKKIRGPFPLEELPQEFYNAVLEKMPLDDFKQFNLGSKLTASMCEAFEIRDGTIDLEQLTQNLYSTVVEKLPFKDLTMFNLGSRLTVEMCDQLREIEAPVQKVYIHQEVESFKTERKKAILDLIPEKVRLHAGVLEIEKKDVTTIEKYKISADVVEFFGDTGSDPEFVQEVLRLTRPEEIFFESTYPEVLKLEELKKVEDVVFLPWNGFNDRDLLAIDLEYFTVGVRPWHAPAVTSQGILQLLQEWKLGMRKITYIKIMFSGLDRPLILKEFPGRRQDPSQRMVLCKGDGKTDCVVDTIMLNTLRIYEQKCEGPQRGYKFGRRTCCIRWEAMRRSPPL